MQIVVDVREEALIRHLSSLVLTPIQMETKALDIGDIVFNDGENPVVIIERKSLTDLLSSIRDGRYAEQSHRLIHCGGVSRHNIVYLIEGIMHSLNSESQRQLVHSTMTSLSLFKGFTVIRTATVQESAEFIVNMYKKITRDLAAGKQMASSVPSATDVTENNDCVAIMPNGGAIPNGIPYAGFVKKVKKENITQENIASIMLSQIPGVSAATAQEIVDQHGGSLLSLIQLCKDHPDTAFQESYLSSSSTGTKRRKLGSNVREALVKYLSTI
jgi:crossover junction endonuclease MUS81